MTVKIFHAADIHIDSPLRGLSAYDGAPVDAMRSATRRAFEGLVSSCVNERADLLVLAGDLYDGDWRDFGTGLFFVSQMRRLCDSGIPVCIVAGNHDARSVITRNLRLPPNVHLFSADEPETKLFEDIGVAVHGQSFPTRSVPDDLSARYPGPTRGLFNLGLLHTSADGREGHENYAPCGVSGLTAKGYDYWALGHVHRREVLSESPWVVFSGNLQGRHARETGPKGASLVSIANGKVTAVEERHFDVVRWAICDVDATGAVDGDEVLDRVAARIGEVSQEADGRPVCARVVIEGVCTAHRALFQDAERWVAEVRAAAGTHAAGDVWVEKVRLGTSAVDGGMAASGELAGLLRPADDILADAELVAAVRGDLSSLAKKLPPELRDGADGVDLSSDEAIARALRRAAALLESRLMDPRGTK